MGSYLNSEILDSFAPAYLKLVRFPASLAPTLVALRYTRMPWLRQSTNLDRLMEKSLEDQRQPRLIWAPACSASLGTLKVSVPPAVKSVSRLCRSQSSCSGWRLFSGETPHSAGFS